VESDRAAVISDRTVSCIAVDVLLGAATSQKVMY
jgi:hypothetical protein